MLLLFLLMLEEEGEKKRALIDALLAVDVRTAASIAREAEVAPAALSNLRRPNGAGQVSQESQDRLLAALGWPYGRLNPNVSYRWKITNRDSIQAVKWLLEEQVTGKSNLARVLVENKDSVNEQMPVLIGRIGESNAISSIAFHALNAEVQAGYAKLLDAGILNLREKPVVVRFDEHRAIYRAEITDSELEELCTGRRKSSPPPNPELPAETIEQYRQLGFTTEDHYKLLKKWLAKMASEDPVGLSSRMKTLKRLDIDAKAFSPSTMSVSDIQDLIDRLAKSRAD